MAEYVIVGGSRKNPAVEKINNPKASAEEKARLYLAEMKAMVLGAGDPGKPKTPDIPINFNKVRE
ncbi:MAG: hypothetical protein LBH28_10845 [Oscillospiraceae bacterium]|jgi:hypothetical protein|nr:hypothetical protein [Oscillospiraceae bacterium]